MISHAVLPDEVYESDGHGAVVTEGKGFDDDLEADKIEESSWKKQ